jgi:mannosyltransferase OCH1-like enzyme
MFPKHIFQVWFQGCSLINRDDFLQNTRNWKLLNNEWNYYCISEKELRIACESYSKECVETFDKFTNMHLKIDFGRYVMLYLKGGIYVDMDAYIVRSLDSSKHVKELIQEFLNGNHVLGLSSLYLSPPESYIVVGHPTMLNNAIMMASPLNPLLKDFIDAIINKARLQTKSTTSYIQIQNLTGPVHFNEYFQPLIKKHLSGHIIKVFPSEVFEPCHKHDCDITSRTISIHSMERSWLSPEISTLLDGYVMVKHYIPLLFMIPLLFLICRKCKNEKYLKTR